MSECGQRTPHRAVRRRRIPYRLRPDSPPVPLVAQCQHGFRTAVEPGELRCRMQAAGIDAEWADICRDLNALTETEIEQNGKRFLVRSATRGSVAAILPSLCRCPAAANHSPGRTCRAGGGDAGDRLTNPSPRNRRVRPGTEVWCHNQKPES